MLVNLGLGANRVYDDGMINRARVDAYGQPNHQHGPAIQHRQPAYEDVSDEEDRIVDHHRTNQRRGASTTQP